ncbi:hypothetical protein [Cohnella sp. WQ 127256]|uniref:hypothetical protein n=1 Tax=Cohnella sp. WQ 127256 TaxID=2938790 RepID=UPI0021197263|nr:hypothetical protein [Cohnella sp. WQ 127256]
MAGRNNKPDNDGPASSPSQLGQFGSKLAEDNEDEFQAALAQECEIAEEACTIVEEPDH